MVGATAMEKRSLGITFFGIIEILIGAVTLIALLISLILGRSTKPFEVLIFVLTTSIISLSLGIGILKHRLTSYHLLLFLAAVIVLSKILIFANIINLNGALETTIPSPMKNTISILYHSLLIMYFNRPKIKEYFS
jgi:hypothetical protein